jgi:hypothetical protein
MGTNCTAAAISSALTCPEYSDHREAESCQPQTHQVCARPGTFKGKTRLLLLIDGEHVSAPATNVTL